MWKRLGSSGLKKKKNYWLRILFFLFLNIYDSSGANWFQSFSYRILLSIQPLGWETTFHIHTLMPTALCAHSSCFQRQAADASGNQFLNQQGLIVPHPFNYWNSACLQDPLQPCARNYEVGCKCAVLWMPLLISVLMKHTAFPLLFPDLHEHRWIIGTG